MNEHELLWCLHDILLEEIVVGVIKHEGMGSKNIPQNHLFILQTASCLIILKQESGKEGLQLNMSKFTIKCKQTVNEIFINVVHYLSYSINF